MYVSKSDVCIVVYTSTSADDADVLWQCSPCVSLLCCVDVDSHCASTNVTAMSSLPEWTLSVEMTTIYTKSKRHLVVRVIWL